MDLGTTFQVAKMSCKIEIFFLQLKDIIYILDEK